MNTIGLLEAIVTSCFALAVGFLTPLIWTERPILGLVFNPSSKSIQDGEVRRIHSAIAVIAASGAPKICAVFQVTGTALSVVNAWLTGFDRTFVLFAALSVSYVCIAMTTLRGVVGAVASTAGGTQSSTSTNGASSRSGNIDVVRAATRRAMVFHHFGFTVCLLILVCHVVLKNI